MILIGKIVKIIVLIIGITSFISIVPGCSKKESTQTSGRQTANSKPSASKEEQSVNGSESEAKNIEAKGNQASNISAKISEQKIQEETETLVTDLKIPAISGLNDKKIEEKFNNMLKDDATSIKTSIEKSSREALENSRASNFQFIKFSIRATFEVSYNKNGILSLTSTYNLYTGGAHGGQVRKSYNIDLSSGKLLQLSDLFQKDFDYKEVLSSEILNKMKANPENYMSDAITAFKKIGDDRPFYIEEGNLVLYYGEYEIAPYAAGIPEFRIPFTMLKFNTPLGIR